MTADGRKSCAAEGEDRKKIFPPEDLSTKAYIKSFSEYKAIYERSVDDPDGFWGEMAETLDWYRKWDRVFSWDAESHECEWFSGGKLNVAYNCIDRHIRNHKQDKIALIWEPDIPGPSKTFTYLQLYDEVTRFANVLKKHGVTKGDRVCVYLPMIPELPIAMLACARIGAIHSVVFAGFSSDSLRDRILDSDCRTLVCSDASYRSGKIIPLKKNADWALEECPDVADVFVVDRTGTNVEMKAGRDHWWREEISAPDISSECPCEEMDAEDPLFILYTSGSTGKPKGVLHTTAGYLLHVSLSHKWIFDIHDDDVWWCTGDIGWVTGHSYMVYGPLANGHTGVMFEGVPTYPEPDRFWEIVEKNRVTVFYTVPTVVRALMRLGDKWTKTRDLSSLRVLGTVGEPISPEVWLWYFDNVGKGRCPICDTWWQTESGGILITTFTGATPMKPGSAGFAFPGVMPVVLKQDGSEAEADERGFLCIRRPWPGMMRTFYGNHELFVNTYWSRFPGVYLTGDGCMVDDDGFYWLQGRVDDVINVSGHRFGTEEVERALADHDLVAEVAVVGMPHNIKGQGIYAYVRLKTEYEDRDENDVRGALKLHVRKEISPIAMPDVIQFIPALPRTCNGKIVRRVLRKIAEGRMDSLGDVTTLADPGVVDIIIQGAREAVEVQLAPRDMPGSTVDGTPDEV